MSAHSELMKPRDPDQLDREKEEWIKSQIEYLMSPGQKCDPLKAENIVEAIAQMDYANLNLLRHYVASASDRGISHHIYQHINLSDFLVTNNKRYWQGMAEFLANKEWDEKIN